MPIYFLRHGESEANVRGVFAGQKDNAELSNLGIEQARKAGEELKPLGIQRIVASGLKRTNRTAHEVAIVIGFDETKIELDDRILEYDMGALTSTPLREVTSQELTSADGAEDAIAFKNRILSFLRQYKDSPEIILVVSHGGVGRAIEAAKQGVDPHELFSMPLYPNASPVLLDLAWL
jgi:broad specificity phosphatase PhoE